jgi:hypothetical protein
LAVHPLPRTAPLPLLLETHDANRLYFMRAMARQPCRPCPLPRLYSRAWPAAYTIPPYAPGGKLAAPHRKTLASA